jgi:transcriptional regulator of heat shock response
VIMSEMTPRQRKLLQAIINEFIESAEAVGSMNLLHKYGWDLSSATIRNEMAELMRQGYLSKPHSSAGRVPTTRAYKEFAADLQEEMEDLDVLHSSLIRQELFRHRFDLDDLIYTALKALVEETGNVSMALIGNRMYHAGLAQVPTIPEYRQVQGLCNLISVIEDRITLKDILSRNMQDDKVRILFGSDTGLDVFEGTVIVYRLVHLYENAQGYIGVIGPERIDYSKVVPTVDFVATTTENVIGGWR